MFAFIFLIETFKKTIFNQLYNHNKREKNKIYVYFIKLASVFIAIEKSSQIKQLGSVEIMIKFDYKKLNVAQSNHKTQNFLIYEQKLIFLKNH